MKTTRPTNRRQSFHPNLVSLEDRAVPAFGFGSAFSFGSATADFTASLDVGTDIATDAAGSIYVSGYYSSTVDFDPNGTNPDSNHVLTSIGVNDGYAVKYLADGTFQWATDLGPAGLAAIAVQGANVYVGYSDVYGTSPVNNTFVTQLNAADGSSVWTTTFATNIPDRSVDVVAGPSGSVYVTGNNALAQAVVAKIDAAGAIQWTATGTGGSSLGRGIAVDGSANVFVTGDFTGAVTFGSNTLTSQAGTKDAFVWKLNASGATIWAGSVGGIGTDSGYDVAADALGNAVVIGQWGTAANISKYNDFDPGSGTVKLTHNGGDDIFIAKLAPNTGGTMKLAWAKDIGGTGMDWGRSVTLDVAGNVYSTGSYTGPVDFDPGSQKSILPGFGINPTTNQVPRTVFVSKLNAGGNFVAAAAMGGLGYDDGAAIALDDGNNVWTTGGFRDVADFDPTAGTYNLTQSGHPTYIAYDAFVSKLTQSSPLNAAGRTNSEDSPIRITETQFQPIVSAAIDRWAAAGLDTIRLNIMRNASVTIADLGGSYLGLAIPETHGIRIDDNAAGFGWFVDSTPLDDSEFIKPSNRIVNRIDLVSVVAHELGHLVGLGDDHSQSSNVMGDSLSTGVRRMPSIDDDAGQNLVVPMRRIARR